MSDLHRESPETGPEDGGKMSNADATRPVVVTQKASSLDVKRLTSPPPYGVGMSPYARQSIVSCTSCHTTCCYWSIMSPQLSSYSPRGNTKTSGYLQEDSGPSPLRETSVSAAHLRERTRRISAWGRRRVLWERRECSPRPWPARTPRPWGQRRMPLGFYLTNEGGRLFAVTVAHNFAVGDPACEPGSPDDLNKSVGAGTIIEQPARMDFNRALKKARKNLAFDQLAFNEAHPPQPSGKDSKFSESM